MNVVPKPKISLKPLSKSRGPFLEEVVLSSDPKDREQQDCSWVSIDINLEFTHENKC